MKTDDFNYDLPPELVAQFPLANRDTCKLLYLSRVTGECSDLIFNQLTDILKPGDRLVFNNTKVIPSRLFCHLQTGGAVELLLTEPCGVSTWKAIVRPGRKLLKGVRVFLDSNPKISFEIIAVLEDGLREIAVCNNMENHDIESVIHTYGVMALPHYINREVIDTDKEMYQTIYAKHEGAIACPTAGLHFSQELLQKLMDNGIDTSYVTLHVGIGTFKPVSVDDPLKHHMHFERYDLSPKTVQEIQKTKNAGGRIFAVGTTVVRVLEHCATLKEKISASNGQTNLMILPGFEFKIIDGLITNFHVPKSTLLMLISAFAGREKVLSAYRHAIESQYRFFSYGDAMIIV